MRKVVLTELLSLDGVAEAPNTFFFDWDEVVDAQGAAIIETQDAVILGRRSYDEWAEFWPDSDIEPLARALLAADVVDELRLTIAPVVAGRGTPAARRPAAAPPRTAAQHRLALRLPDRRLPRRPVRRARPGALPKLGQGPQHSTLTWLPVGRKFLPSTLPTSK